MKHQTLTVENSRIRVTVSREIADKSVIPHLIFCYFQCLTAIGRSDLFLFCR